MSKVLFINGPAKGHVYPTLGLVQQLVERGEEVFYVTSEEFASQLKEIGANVYPYDNFLLAVDPFQNQHFMGIVNQLLSSYDVILPCVLALTRQHKFDYIVHDSMYGCGNVTAQLVGLPHISTCTSFIHVQRFIAENIDAKRELIENLTLLREFSALSHRIGSRYGIKIPAIQDIFFNAGQINLVFTSEAFHPERAALDEQYIFVGASLADRGEQEVITKQYDEQRVVYISLGTIFNEMKSFYELCFEALASLDVLVVMAVGSKIDIAAFSNVPANFILRNDVSQLDVLQMTDVFITHGGMNSVQEAFYYSVPLIVVPMGADQPAVANRVLELGAGLVLDKAQLNSRQLTEAVKKVLAAEEFQLQSLKLGNELRRAGGQRRAADEIFRWKSQWQ